MATKPYSPVDPALYPAGAPTAPAGSALSWSAVFAGTVAAIALTLTLLTLGSAFGLASVSPWPGVGAKPTTFTIGAGIWLIVTQWLSAAIGGYLAGRLRIRWHELHGDEVFFRDTAHGLLTWATATVIMAIVAVGAFALSSIGVAPHDAVVTKEAADAARKVAAAFATFTGLSLVIGAFIGSVSAVVGGRLRDMHP
ncbi:MAG: hypothetical protein JWL96_2863 [Sphingomonas bacterium]|uniref:hypothetical protein n=1 Tax=Sphingomonas bacterium TaxID=1895847 RepID=UPI002605EC91|nr:hypothetical protein [Sphingomonas bacterium]MDB5710793.1 hypothetical protein [Sphingomonas bacterium]